MHWSEAIQELRGIFLPYESVQVYSCTRVNFPVWIFNMETFLWADNMSNKVSASEQKSYFLSQTNVSNSRLRQSLNYGKYLVADTFFAGISPLQKELI